MAKHRFKKGNQYAKGNTIAPQIFEGRKLTKLVYEEILHKYTNKPLRELQKLMADPGDTPAIEMLVVSILAKAMATGDHQRAEFLLSRLVPKVAETVRVEDVTETEKAKIMAEKLLEIAKDPK